MPSKGVPRVPPGRSRKSAGQGRSEGSLRSRSPASRWVQRPGYSDGMPRPYAEVRGRRTSSVCFLVYVLWKTLEQWQRGAGLGHSPRTIFDELRRIQSTDVVLPTEDGREIRLRCVVRPDAAQAALLDRLGLREEGRRLISFTHFLMRPHGDHLP